MVEKFIYDRDDFFTFGSLLTAHGSRLTAYGLRLSEPVLPTQVLDLVGVEAEPAGRLRLDAARLGDRVGEEPPLEVRDRRREVFRASAGAPLSGRAGRVGAQRARQVVFADLLAVREEHQRLDRVTQLADVAAPRVRLEALDDRGRQRLRPAAMTRGEPAQEVVRD